MSDGAPLLDRTRGRLLGDHTVVRGSTGQEPEVDRTNGTTRRHIRFYYAGPRGEAVDLAAGQRVVVNSTWGEIARIELNGRIATTTIDALELDEGAHPEERPRFLPCEKPKHSSGTTQRSARGSARRSTAASVSSSETDEPSDDVAGSPTTSPAAAATPGSTTSAPTSARPSRRSDGDERARFDAGDPIPIAAFLRLRNTADWPAELELVIDGDTIRQA